ncbi:sugar-transfer associated ATP-grasp domain-containing protein [Rhodohalobacter sp. SW132]|uniref:sugar-transfer associated ATP-grasp domain-containing protein n=1 Tax=Rhodohalobacter sp. SW132 TaxID=2293433 RepID=UPI0011C02442|nr:sugar-transfer associated ATP-grasp domain-containing protein [Rhodohalobacter sp. SW132]
MIFSNPGNLIRNGYSAFTRWRNYSNSRKQAKNFRDAVIKENGGSRVTSDMITSMKSEMKERFGDDGHWPWIALYAELRGEYIPGWLPDDHYAFQFLPSINRDPGAVLSTVKTYDHRLFQGFAIEPLALRISGSWFLGDMRKIENEDPLRYIRNLGREIVIKRDKAPSGKGILFKHSNEVTDNDFKPGYDYLVQPSVRQHTSLAELHRESVSTLRITTYLMPDGAIEVKHRTIRFGVSKDRVVNSSGLFVFLNDDGHVVSNARDDLGLDRGSEHPDTKYPYKNLIVPSMSIAIQHCKEAHLTFPYIRFIAWDLYIDETGQPKMIEWNARRPDMWVNEALIGPLWGDEFDSLAAG